MNRGTQGRLEYQVPRVIEARQEQQVDWEKPERLAWKVTQEVLERLETLGPVEAQAGLVPVDSQVALGQQVSLVLLGQQVILESEVLRVLQGMQVKVGTEHPATLDLRDRWEFEATPGYPVHLV